MKRDSRNRYNKSQCQLKQQPFIKFRFLLFSHYVLMLIQLAAFFMTAIFLLRKPQSYEFNHLFTFLIVLLLTIFGCTLYQHKLIFDVKQRFHNNTQEYELNQGIYESTIKFFYFFTNQEKLKIIRLLNIYNSVVILLIIQNILNLQIEEYHKKQNNLSFDLSKSINYLIILISDQPMMIVICILSLILAFAFIIFEIYKLVFFLILSYNKCSSFTYYSSSISRTPKKTIVKARRLCLITIIFNLSKSIILFVMISSTPNSTSLTLIASNIFYHLFFVFFQLLLLQQINSIYYNLKNRQENKIPNICYDDHSKFINSLFRINNFQNKMFSLFLIICVLFTLVGSLIYERNIITSRYAIFFYEDFIQFDCQLFQFIFLALMIFKFSLEPFWKDFSFKLFFQNQSQVLQDQQFNQIDQQSIEISVQQLSIDYRKFNQKKNPNSLELLSLTNVRNYFIYNVELQNKSFECTICLEQINQSEIPIIQLKCHNTHIFHEKCIRDWLQQNKKCPLCNTQFIIE
ncbi:unnamed protein product [Paramecium sonneborni]|uniref:RING-type domain-containing protein n=1 Tax=Paramecium sonneborni TaxID=65129 RepID=A0A8S1PZ76_9CILI|nr:unnamed protein product [Paramecium sonneborni]